MNKFFTAHRSCTTKYFWKNSYKSLQSTSLSFFWHLLSPNWSIYEAQWDFEECLNIHGRIAGFEGKCLRFRNSSDNWPIWTQKVPKEALRSGLWLIIPNDSRWLPYSNDMVRICHLNFRILTFLLNTFQFSILGKTKRSIIERATIVYHK